jgi:S-DNA-T family DNA segregation ATPase FtsK/SpoIIIE
VRIARVGRALGLRLILAMQRPAGIVDGQIEANTRFRLCLRVAQTEDSQAMLKRPDAAFLSGMGRAYLQVGANEKFKEFQVAWSGAPYDPQRAALGNPLEIAAVQLDGSRRSLYAPVAPTEHKPQSQLDAVVAELQDTAAMLHLEPLPSLWLEPLPERLALDTVRHSEGWDGRGWRTPATWLAPVVGLVDIPREKRQQPLELNLGKEGHLAVYSAPGYGKTTFLQTLLLSLALSHSPDDVQFYVLDFGSRMLKLFEELPHTGGVITADESERMERLFLLLQRKLDERRLLFSQAGAGGLASYRQITGRQEPAIVVVLDNYANFLEAVGDDDTAPNFIGRLAREGGNLGIHLVLTANNSTSIRFSTASNIMLAVALHLVEQSEYGSIVGRSQELKPLAVPGRGLVRGAPPLECQIALPVAGENDGERVQALRRLIEAMRDAWHGRRPKPVNMLGDVVPLSAALAAELPLELAGGVGAGSAGSVGSAIDAVSPAALGLHVDDLTRFTLALKAGPHFLIAGPARSGKSTLLRTWAHSLAAAPGAAGRLRLYVLDSRRQSLHSLRDLPAVAGYSSEPAAADELLTRIEADLASLPASGAANGAEHPAEHPTVIVIADDFGDRYDDALAESSHERLAALLRLGRNRPFHLLLAGRAADLSSKSYLEPVKSLKEAQVGFMLGSGEDLIFNTRLPYTERSKLLPEGEGFYINRAYVRRIKIAVPDAELQRQLA